MTNDSVHGRKVEYVINDEYWSTNEYKELLPKPMSLEEFNRTYIGTFASPLNSISAAVTKAAPMSEDPLTVYDIIKFGESLRMDSSGAMTIKGNIFLNGLDSTDVKDEGPDSEKCMLRETHRQKKALSVPKKGKKSAGYLNHQAGQEAKQELVKKILSSRPKKTMRQKYKKDDRVGLFS